MDAEKALELVKQGGTLLLLDVPQFTLIGIDTQMFSSGPVFKGIKMIPPGVHFLYYSSSNREGNEFSAVVGLFLDVKLSEVIIRKWDKKEERLLKIPEEEAISAPDNCISNMLPKLFGSYKVKFVLNNIIPMLQEERYIEAVKRLEFDRQLGPYTLDQYGEWNRLSNYITKSTIERLEPLGGEITIACENDITANIPKSPVERALDEQLKISKFSRNVENSQRKGCYYTPIPRIIKKKGLTGPELTKLNLDKSQLLETMLVKEYKGAEDALLAELQFSLIAFLMGQSLEAFFQWKLLVSLLLGCTEAPLNTRSQFFTKFIKVTYYQLNYGFQKGQKNTSAPERGVFTLLDESWLSADSFLHHLCKDFFSLVLEASVVNGDLLTWTRKLKYLLEETLGWDFNKDNAAHGMYFEEDDEFAPVLVEMLDDFSEASS